MAWNPDFREGLLVPVVENQVQKIMDSELETGVFWGFKEKITILGGLEALNPKP